MQIIWSFEAYITLQTFGLSPHHHDGKRLMVIKWGVQLLDKNIGPKGPHEKSIKVEV